MAAFLKPVMVLALSCICGGGISNLLDRAALGGYVVDFLNVGWGGFRSGIFNMADVAIALGLLLLGVAATVRLCSGLWSKASSSRSLF
jgi:signal peptidase II